MKIKYSHTIDDNAICITTCPNYDTDIMVGSIGCSECDYCCKIDTKNRIVICGYDTEQL